MRFKLFAAAAALALATGAAAQSGDATPEFTPERFRSHVAFLSHDLLEGRDAGSKGYELGAHYVATQFEGLGLTPGGDGGWYQQVPFLQYKLSGDSARVTIGGRSFANRADVLVSPSPVGGEQTVEAPVVFVGYGIDSPGLGIDDYKGLDVKGKIVAMLGGTPKGLPSDVAAHTNSDKRRMAAARGAVGIIMLRSAEEATRRPWARLAEGAGEPALTWLGKDEQPYSASPGIRARASLDTAASQALFAGAPRSFAQIQADATKGGRIKGFALKQAVRIEGGSEVTRTTSPNVLGIIPGSDPALANEYVLLMAHLDGLGVHDREGEDDIHNGAMDNSTGIATLIEVARAIQESGNRPRRPILLAAVTAEEDGLLGAQYLARNPTVPAGGRVVGVVNLDMPVLLYDFQDVIAFGAEHSTMGPVVERAAARIGIKLTPDPLPQEGLFTRSDHYRFVQEGVPSVFLMTGFANGGQEKFTGFLATDYHKPTDDMKLPFDWKAGAKFARINYLIASEIANAPEAPRWYDDSFFGKSLAPKADKAARPAR